MIQMIYSYEITFINSKPRYSVIDPDGNLQIFDDEISALFYVEYLNNLTDNI